MEKAGACGLGIQFPHTDLFVNAMIADFGENAIGRIASINSGS